MANIDDFTGKWTVKYMEVLDEHGRSEKITLEKLMELKDEFPAEEFANEVETFKFVIDIQNGILRIMHPRQDGVSLEDFINQNKASNIAMIDDMAVLQESQIMPRGKKISFYGFLNQPMEAKLVNDMLYIEEMGMYLQK